MPSGAGKLPTQEADVGFQNGIAEGELAGGTIRVESPGIQVAPISCRMKAAALLMQPQTTLEVTFSW